MMMQFKQLFLQPTPKQFVYVSFIYAIIAPVIGVLVASPMFSAFMMLALLGFAFFAMVYLKPSVPEQFSNPFNGAAFLLIPIAFLLEPSVAYTEIPTDKTQLLEVTGVVQERVIIDENGKQKRYPLSVEISGERLRCDIDYADNCALLQKYKGQQATALYQPVAEFSNFLYEVKVDGQTVYSFEQQLPVLKAAQNKHRLKMFWMVILFLLPTFWFYRQDKRLKQNMAKMSYEEVEAAKAKQDSNTSVGCAVGIFIMIAVSLAIAGAIFMTIQKFEIAAVLMIMFAITAFISYWLAKPQK